MLQEGTIAIGKAVGRVARLRGGGSSLPGLVVEHLDPAFLERSFAQIPGGAVLVTGTNGKTTTTKMVVELLRGQGLRVLTNPTGSNLTRGVVTALLDAADRQGRLAYDIAVLELDEAYAAAFVRRVRPRAVAVLNVMRDQLDRFGELDHTARLLHTVTRAASGAVVLNRDDPYADGLAAGVSAPVHGFGAAAALRPIFVGDDRLPVHTDGGGLGGTAPPVPEVDQVDGADSAAADVELESFEHRDVVYRVGGRALRTTMKAGGVHNFLNGAAALALARALLPDVPAERLVADLGEVRAAFGRGETLDLPGGPCELMLVKNPAGFRLSLASLNPPADGHGPEAVMIAVNDHHADGRDVSWLWDVDFEPLREHTVRAVTGVRAYEMALRLTYDGIEVAGPVEPDIRRAVSAFTEHTAGHRRRFFCTYTAMLTTRRALGLDHLA